MEDFLLETENNGKSQRYNTKYRLFLSEKDEYVPTTHVGLYSLFRNPQNKAVFMSEQICQSIRTKTYDAVMELFRTYESCNNFCDFFNYNTKAITEIGRNYFTTNDKFAPIAELVEMFPYQVDTGNVPAIAISFGIEKLTLKLFIQSLRDGTDFWEDPPAYVKKRKKETDSKKDFIMFGTEKVKIDAKYSIYMPKNPLYQQFLDWCKIQDIEPYEGMLMAIDYMMEKHPADELEPVAMYDKFKEIDLPIYAKPKRNTKKTERTVVLSGVLCSIADKIIERFNRDPKNISKRVDFDLYCNNALHLMNESMPLEYRDPDLYDETVQLEQVGKYNNNLLEDTH